MPAPGWYKVTAIGFNAEGSRYKCNETGEWKPMYGATCYGFSNSGFDGNCIVRKGWSKADKQARWDAALDYQDNLTKVGKPPMVKACKTQS